MANISVELPDSEALLDAESKWLRRLQLEKIISKMARDFVTLDNVQIGIMTALKEIGEFSGASRAYIFEFKNGSDIMDNTYEWCQEGISPEIDNLKDLPTNMFPWWIEKISRGEVLDIHDVQALGPEASAEKEILEMQGIRSVLVLPIMVRTKLHGFVGFDNNDSTGNWHQDDMAALGIAAEFMSNVFERMQSERELSDAKDELEAILNSLQSMQAKLIQQEQMVAIGQLAAGVAHEINNPLGFVLSNHKTLKVYTNKLMAYIDKGIESTLDPKDAKEYTFIKEDTEDLFSDMDIGLQRVKKIVESLRFFSRIDSLTEFEPYDIKEGIQNTLIIIHSRVKESVDLVLKLDAWVPMIEAHGSKMNQVILNLIVNALDAVQEQHPLFGGRLEIETFERQKHVHFIVKDNGIGMSESVKQQIFNPFFTTKPVGQGTGLGMSIVYDIVKNTHKGEIVIESQSGQGTTISVILPISTNR